MKSTRKILLASALLGGLALPSAFGQTYIDPNLPPPLNSTEVDGLALLAGWDFEAILTTTVPAAGVRARYSDVYGDNSSASGVPAAGGIYFNNTLGSTTGWATSNNKNTVGDINQDIRTRSGSGSSFDLGGLTNSGDGAWIANSNTTGLKFSINVHTLNVNQPAGFEQVQLSLWGRDTDITTASAAGVTINWFYSVNAGVTQVDTGLKSVFNTNTFSNSLVDFSSITALNGQANIYLIGQVVEANAAAVLNLDNIAVYGVAAIPEPSTYAAILGLVSMGIVGLRRRKNAQIA